jgi:hypothetical protein
MVLSSYLVQQGRSRRSRYSFSEAAHSARATWPGFKP